MAVSSGDTDFLLAFEEVIQEATAIVVERNSSGRNEAIKVKEQFESTEFVLDLIRMKCQRAKSYLAAGNLAKFVEEMHDVINYGAFAVVFERPPA